MHNFYVWVERTLGFLIMCVLGCFFSVQAAAQQSPLYIYHLDRSQFADIIRSQALMHAEDAASLRAFILKKYGLKDITDLQMKEILSVEDLEQYQRQMHLYTGATTSNPTCICD